MDWDKWVEWLRANGLAETTVNQYTCHARRLTRVLESADEEGLIHLFGNTLAGRTMNYRRYNYIVLKQVFNFNKWEFPATVKKPKVVRTMINRPRLTWEIPKLIEHAPKLFDIERFYLTMSTIYGLRVGELSKLRAEHFDTEHLRFWVETGKYGVKRWQVLPPGLNLTCDITPVTDPRRLGEMFKHICKGAGITAGKGCGWHSIRRGLAGQLSEMGHSATDIKNFLRWAYFEKDILDIYIGEPTQLKFEMSDTKILNNHPFLSLWKKINGGNNSVIGGGVGE